MLERSQLEKGSEGTYDWSLSSPVRDKVRRVISKEVPRGEG